GRALRGCRGFGRAPTAPRQTQALGRAVRSAMTKRSRQSSERGAVIIQMAVCLLVLLAFSAFVVDYGVMWASRGHAQTAADAGALAGAISLAFDSGTDFAGAKLKARLVAR